MLHLLLLFHQVIRLPDAYVNSTAAANPPPSTMDDSSIRHMLDNVMTVQVASGQLLVDVLMKPQALRAELASFRRSPLNCPLAIRHENGEYFWMELGGDFFFLELWSFRLYLGASLCTYFMAHDVFILTSSLLMSCI